MLDLRLTSLTATIGTSGMRFLFCLATYLSVSRALAVRPDSMSRRGLSGSHCVTRRGLGSPLALFYFIFQGHQLIAHIVDDEKNAHRNHGQPQQPPPAQCGHNQQHQQDLEDATKHPEQLKHMTEEGCRRPPWFNKSNTPKWPKRHVYRQQCEAAPP